MRKILLFVLSLAVSVTVRAQNVSLDVTDREASDVFRALVVQTGKNFVYSSDLLKGMRISLHVSDKPLKNVLSEIFRGTDIEFRIKKDDVILRRKKAAADRVSASQAPRPGLTSPQKEPLMLQEVVVVSRLEAPQTATAEIGAKKLTAGEILRTPTLFGEPDVIKSLMLQPGVSADAEGTASMHVHGGSSDENLYMLDNVPLYQVNHFAGLFSAFNPEAIRYIDFYKSSFPAKYDGRLSSFLDVRTRNGSLDGHHGSARLGLTAGAFNIDGPISRRTTYSVALRRSWYDLLTIPVLGMVNAGCDEKIRFHYDFMDLNAKIAHRFDDMTTGVINVYFGDDLLNTGTKDSDNDAQGWHSDDKYNFHWGNLVAQASLTRRFTDRLSGEFTAAYTRFFTGMKQDEKTIIKMYDHTETSRSLSKYHNNINDWIFRGDFTWRGGVRFGAGYVRHSFLPSRIERLYEADDTRFESRDSTWSYRADEVNAYIEDDLTVGDRWRINAGLHGSLFNIEGKTKWGLSPRLSVSYRPSDSWAVKGAYSRTVQYVHQLSQSYLALPTDQWIPVTGKFRPQTADKISFGVYRQSADSRFAASIEGYWKWMHNLIDYRDEYYLQPPVTMWDAQLTTGRGTAKGLDFKVEKLSGKFTGHISYSLAWADRTFRDKNMGMTYPARFDHRHTINILANWNINGRVSLNASWTGHSGNRFTLLTQMWEPPEVDGIYPDSEVPLRAPINSYQLPFYHRLDLSCTVRNRRGYWTFGLYNAYCHLNTVAVRRTYTDNGDPIFQKVKLLPLIPSISYTWQF